MPALRHGADSRCGGRSRLGLCRGGEALGNQGLTDTIMLLPDRRLGDRQPDSHRRRDVFLQPRCLEEPEIRGDATRVPR